MVDDATRCVGAVQQSLRQHAAVLVVPVVREDLVAGPVSQADDRASVRIYAHLVGRGHLLCACEYTPQQPNRLRTILT